ncbi:MAG: metallophosphoesterase [Zoogloea sp.]|nr:metallophosphoesterase [Zoogloea sp.]
MSIILQVSDLHFGTGRPPLVEALLALAEALGPDLVVVSGDVTQRARPAEFAAEAFVARLPAAGGAGQPRPALVRSPVAPLVPLPRLPALFRRWGGGRGQAARPAGGGGR